MKNSVVTIVFIIVLSCVSCQRHKREIASLTAERDTLQARYARQEAQYTTLKAYVDDISSALDSIAIHEDMLFLPNPETPHVPLTKQQIQQKLDEFQQLILRQHKKIETLEDELLSNNSELRHIHVMLVHFKTQIEEKNEQIADLKRELRVKTANIKVLKSQVNTLQSDVDSLHAGIDTLYALSKMQDELLNLQGAKLYEAYYIIGTRNELFRKGIVRNSVVVSSLDLTLFEKVDKRTFLEIPIPSSRAKVLTNSPADSYSFVKGHDGNLIIKINDVEKFWSLSQILVIQQR